VGVYYVGTSALDNNPNPNPIRNPKPTPVTTADAPTRPTSEYGHYLLTQAGADQCKLSSYRGGRPTQTHTHPATHSQTGPITIHCVAASQNIGCVLS